MFDMIEYRTGRRPSTHPNPLVMILLALIAAVLAATVCLATPSHPAAAAGKLVGDPLLGSTYLGGSGMDGHYEVPIAVAGDGSIYVASVTNSTDFPATPGCYDADHNGGYDLFISRFDADMTTLLASTYLGGTADDQVWPGVDMALDSAGNVFVASATRSADFPLPPGAYCETIAGSWDIVIAKMSSDLSTVLAATFIGGASSDGFVSLVTDPQDNVYLLAATLSYDWPTTPGVYQPSRRGGRDLALNKFDNDLTTLLASTYLGGSYNDWGEDIVLDSNGDVIVTGWSLSANFPTTPGALQTAPAPGGNYHAFVSRLSSDLTALAASTRLGGSIWDFGYSLAVDEQDNIFVCGHTASGDFPVSATGYCTTYGGGAAGSGDDVYVAKLSHDMTTLLAGTYLGGSAWENGVALCLDGEGSIFVGGTTGSLDFPTTSDAFAEQTNYGPYQYAREMFVSRLDVALTTLEASTYLGGTHNDNLGSFAIGLQGNLYVGGGTGSTDFPIHTAAYDDSFNGGAGNWGGDVIVVEFDPSLSSDENVHVDPELPWRRTSLEHASPNPFNPLTEISFFVEQPQTIRLSVFDLAGHEVQVLAARHYKPGRHNVSWSGQDAAGQRVASGTYVLRLDAGPVQQSLKLTLLK